MKKKIVFIEDEKNLQESFKEIFKNEGFDIFSAYDGQSGISLINKEMPDLILLDLILPKKDGFEVLKEIKENKNISKIPVVVLTNLEGSKDIQKAFSIGALTYLIKANYTPQEIINKVKKILTF